MLERVYKLNISDLARSLGISRQMVYKLANQGMPTDNLEAAVEWRKRNINPFRSKALRIDGNKGVKYQPVKVNNNSADMDRTYNKAEIKIIEETLTRIVPDLWFTQIGRLGRALLHNDINVPVEKLIEVQSALFLMWMMDVDEYLQIESRYEIPFSLRIKPGDEAYPSLIQSINKILSK